MLSIIDIEESQVMISIFLALKIGFSLANSEAEKAAFHLGLHSLLLRVNSLCRVELSIV